MKKMTVKQLEDLIVLYQGAYYSGEGLIDDADFDALWDELKRRAPASAVLQAVGAERRGGTDGLIKVRHIIPMGSQDKAAGEAEFLSWAGKTGLSKYIVQHKLDGASLELQYLHGKLVRAVTRGDGVTGGDITANVRLMRGVVHDLRMDWTGGVRAEVLMFRDVWQEKYSNKANCRNAANGIMRRKDGKGCEDLTLIVYDATSAENDSFFSLEAEKLAWLKERGFFVTWSREAGSAEEVIACRAEISGKRAAIEYDIDGLVVKDPVINIEDLKKARPERQIAFKFELERAVTTLVAIEWSESGATYTPIGIVEPVRLAGTTVKRANLNNPQAIRAMELEIGSRVIIVKRGEIIPKIEGAACDEAGLSGQRSAIVFPQTCSVCGAELVDCGTRLYCPNTACSKRLLHRLEKWVDVLNIAEVGEKFLAQLFEKGRIRRVSDLYTLEAEEIAEYERMGELSAAKVIRNIRTPRTIPLAAFVAGFDIEGVGEVIMEKVVANGFETLEKLRNAKVEEIAAIFGLGEITAQMIFEGLAETAADMDATLSHGYISIGEPREGGTGLEGKSFCFTGELVSMKRAEAEAYVKMFGGSVKNSVVKDLSYLVANNPQSGSSKTKKAKDFGIEIIDEAQFLSLFMINMAA